MIFCVRPGQAADLGDDHRCHGAGTLAYDCYLQYTAPAREAFIGTNTSTHAVSYYATLLHELTHFAHGKRCNRQLGKRFGDSAYTIEDLVAELSAALPLR